MEASTILVDLESFLTRAISISKSTAADETKARERTAGVLRSLLQALLTPGLNPDIDAICRDQLCLPMTQASVGFHGFVFVSSRNTSIPADPWDLVTMRAP
jgi:WD repeat-containing protein 7